MTKHKHFDLILSFANGANIEYFNHNCRWEYIKHPSWHDNYEYRIKPEPKPDIVLYAYAYHILGQDNDFGSVTNAKNIDILKYSYNKELNIKLTYDGETKGLKSAEKI